MRTERPPREVKGRGAGEMGNPCRRRGDQVKTDSSVQGTPISNGYNLHGAAVV
jgi:hypothetical protein